MKFRTYFQKRLLRAVVVLPIGFGLTVAEAMAGIEWFSRPQIATLVAMGGLFIYRFRVHCPSCRENITFLAHLKDARYFQLSRNVHFCPYCGNTLECEVNEVTGAKSHQGERRATVEVLAVNREPGAQR